RDHLPIAEFRTAIEEASQQGSADPAPDFRRLNIDRVLECEPISRPQPVRAGIAVAQHSARALRNQIGQATGEDLAPAGCQLVGLGRNLFEGCQTVQDMMAINRGDRRDVVVARITDFDAAAQITRIGLPSRKATTFSTIWGYELR